jgi:hypothetical protein
MQQQIINQQSKPCRILIETGFRRAGDGNECHQRCVPPEPLDPCSVNLTLSATLASRGRENITKSEALDNLGKNYTEKHIAHTIHQDIPAQKALNVHQQVTN